MNNQLKEKRDLICKAISEKSVIHLKYENFLRVVEPFCCGVSSDENYLLRSYQIGGDSSSNKIGWKLFNLSKMSEIKIFDESFDGKRRGYNPKDSAMVKIYCHIPKPDFS